MSASAVPLTSPFSSFWNRRWGGDYLFLIRNLIAKDFRVRYRNMSLGMFWSLLNPLVMMTVLWFVWTRIFTNNAIPHFAVFALCGLVPFNIFSISWSIGTTSLIDNASLIKRVPVPREIIPIASVLGNCVNMSAQIALLLVMVLIIGKTPNWYWLWLPYLWGFEIVFTCGLVLLFAGLNVYIRDIRYVVESTNVVLFWLVPIVYPTSMIQPQYVPIYHYNPIASMVIALRNIMLDGTAPQGHIIRNLTCVSIAMFIFGLWAFRKLQAKVYNYL
jgi:ABC-type polysaccharide/polyol phosphate export permease